MNVNKCFIGGRFGRDHELRYTPKGVAVLNNSVAVTRHFGSGQDKREETAWFEVTAWGKAAENINAYTGKGSLIWLETRMKIEKWEDKATGQNRSKCVFIVEQFQLCESRDSQAERAENRAQQQPVKQAVPTHSGTGPFDDDGEEDDIPF